MALQIIKPYIHVEDANGNPYVGAKLYIYQPGTTTLADVFTDDGLSVPATNPATSDAAGNFPRLYIAAGTYKLRAVTSANVLIWQEDNIDTGLSAGTGALPISRGGTGATTAAAARAALDVPSNSQITALQQTISALQSAVQNIVSVPQGYLTLTSGVPVIASDVTAGTAVYYTPKIGALVPVFDGAQFNPTTFSELTLTLVSNHVANAIYDVFFTKDTNGSPIIVTGPAWNTATAGSGARGTGAGTTELVRQSGVLVNKFAMTARNGATTYSIDALFATYVGSILMDGTNGQITCHRTYGQSRKWGVWNAYNREPISLLAGDGTASWNYTVNKAPQPYNNASANNATSLTGLSEEEIICEFAGSSSSSPAGSTSSVGIGYNSTSSASGMQGNFANNAVPGTAVAKYVAPPSIGVNTVTALEIVTNAAGGTVTFYGTQTNNQLTVSYNG